MREQEEICSPGSCNQFCVDPIHPVISSVSATGKLLLPPLTDDSGLSQTYVRVLSLLSIQVNRYDTSDCQLNYLPLLTLPSWYSLPALEYNLQVIVESSLSRKFTASSFWMYPTSSCSPLHTQLTIHSALSLLSFLKSWSLHSPKFTCCTAKGYFVLSWHRFLSVLFLSQIKFRTYFPISKWFRYAITFITFCQPPSSP